jgi:AcrR family transcriptional regulator
VVVTTGSATVEGGGPGRAGRDAFEESPAERAPNRRERKKLATRAALEEAALRLFAEKGYEQTTVEEIAAAADVAVRTFFRYFSSKRHVLFGDAAHGRVGRMREALAARPRTEPPLESVRAVLDLLDLGGPDEEAQILRRLALLDRQPSLRATYLMLNNDLRQVLADFVAERTGVSAQRDPYPLLLASAAVASWDVALHVWSAYGGRRSLPTLRRDAFAALTAGITAHPASRRVAR